MEPLVIDETEINIIETTDDEGNSNARIRFGDDSTVAEQVINRFKSTEAVRITIEVDGQPFVAYGPLLTFNEVPSDTEELEEFFDVDDMSGSLSTILEDVEGEFCTFSLEETAADVEKF